MYCIPEMQEEDIKREMETAATDFTAVQPTEPLKVEAMETSDAANQDMMYSQELFDNETVSLEVDSAREDVEDVHKPTETEAMLMRQVQELTRGLEEMKSMVAKKKKQEMTMSLASKLKMKLMSAKPTKFHLKSKPLKSIFKTSKTAPQPKEYVNAEPVKEMAQPLIIVPETQPEEDKAAVVAEDNLEKNESAVEQQISDGQPEASFIVPQTQPKEDKAAVVAEDNLEKDESAVEQQISDGQPEASFIVPQTQPEENKAAVVAEDNLEKDESAVDVGAEPMPQQVLTEPQVEVSITEAEMKDVEATTESLMPEQLLPQAEDVSSPEAKSTEAETVQQEMKDADAAENDSEKVTFTEAMGLVDDSENSGLVVHSQDVTIPETAPAPSEVDAADMPTESSPVERQVKPSDSPSYEDISNDEEGGDNDEGSMNPGGTLENDLLGGEDEGLSDIDESEADKLLASTQQLSVHDDNSSSGASRFYDGGSEVQDEGEVSGEEGEVSGEDYYAKNDDDVKQDEEVFTGKSTETVSNLPSFKSTFVEVKGPVKHRTEEEIVAESVRMSSLIRPPGTNTQMQQVMASRLPSVSSTTSERSKDDNIIQPTFQSTEDVKTTVKKVGISRPGKKQPILSRSPTVNLQNNPEIAAVMEARLNSAKSMLTQPKVGGAGSSQASGILTAKDPNVQTGSGSGPTKPVEQASQVGSMPPDEEETQQQLLDIEGDPFFSGVHV